jgi:hypothetical protein
LNRKSGYVTKSVLVTFVLLNRTCSTSNRLMICVIPPDHLVLDEAGADRQPGAEGLVDVLHRDLPVFVFTSTSATAAVFVWPETV